jgi:glycosyltransferase involved in cell wall biosynthesis
VQLILVNDGSPDGCGAICESYKAKYPENVVYIEQENRGVSAARNVGLDVAVGEFVAFLDGDDRYDARFMESNLTLLSEDFCRIVTCAVNPFGGYNKKNKYLRYSYADNITLELVWQSHYVQAYLCSMMFEANLFTDIRFDAELPLFLAERVTIHNLISLSKTYTLNTNVKYGKRNCSIEDYYLGDVSKDTLYSLFFSAIEKEFNLSESLYGHVTNYTMYSVLEILALAQEFEISICDDISLTHTLTEVIDRISDVVLAESLGLVLNAWLKYTLFKLKQSEYAESYAPYYRASMFIKTIYNAGNKIIISGEVNIAGVFGIAVDGIDLVAICDDTSVIAKLDPDIEASYGYIGIPLNYRRKFKVELADDFVGKISFFFVNRVNADVIGVVIASDYCLFDRILTDWFKMLPGKLVEHTSQNTLQITEVKLDTLKGLVQNTINIHNLGKYQNDVKVLSTWAESSYIKSRKDIVLIVNPYKNDDNRLDFLFTKICEDADFNNTFLAINSYFDYAKLSNHKTFARCVEIGSLEHRLLVLQAKYVLTVSDDVESVFPSELVENKSLYKLYLSFITAKQIAITDIISLNVFLPDIANVLIKYKCMFPHKEMRSILSVDETYELSKKLPNSNGGRFYKKSDVAVGLITDDIFYDALTSVANVIFITPTNWIEERENIDFLLITATWTGLSGEWTGISHKDTAVRTLLVKILSECKQKSIKTVFFCSEDPPYFDTFIGIARYCDYVFTTAEERIDDYIAECGHKNVHNLRFWCNPLFHNPVGIRQNRILRNVLFAGSWYQNHVQRGINAKLLFDGVYESSNNLRIIDRNSELPDAWFYAFPDAYNDSITSAVSHAELMSVHKLYNWCLNLNTVTDSMTMFANRIYELEALGSLCISNYAPSINMHAPLTFTILQRFEVARILDNLSDEEIYERQITGIRHAMTGNTCFDRFDTILDTISMTKPYRDRKIAVVADKVSPTIVKMFEAQSYACKELIVKDDLAKRYSEFDVITFFSENMTYAAFYLEDMINAFKFTDCSYVTKDAFYTNGQLNEGIEHSYVSIIGSKNRTVFWASDYSAMQLLTIEDNSPMKNGYSIDRFNYDAHRKIRRDNFDNTRRYKISVIIPAYNNGLVLYAKSFSSLRRSSLFNELEILIIDDGSTDEITEHYINRLAEEYSNIRTYFFRDGGSGSASRPRNYGVRIAKTKYLAFLDADDEVVNDGLKVLYDTALSSQADIVIGDAYVLRNSMETSLR